MQPFTTASPSASSSACTSSTAMGPSALSPVTCHSCRFCDERFLKFKPYLVHLQLHRHISALFPCGVKPCLRILSSEASLRCHVIRCHRLHVRYPNNSLRSIPLNNQCKFKCAIATCASEFDSTRNLMKHLASHMKSGRSVKCPYPLCNNSYSVGGSLTGHIARVHRQENIDTPHDAPHDEMQDCTDNDDPDDDLMIITEEQSEPAAVIPVDHRSWEKTLAEFFLRLEFKYLIPNRTVQYIATEMHSLHQQSVCQVSSRVKKPYHSDGDRNAALDQCLAESDAAYFKLRTSHRRLTFYKDHYLFVAPEKLPLSEGKYFYYVSIKKTLQKIMLSKSSNIDLNPPTPSEDGILRDFYDGLLFKRNIFFQENTKSFRIILFQDAFEVVCPIGSAKRKYKMLGVYLSLGNMPDYLRTHPDTIQLVALCKEKELDHAKLFGHIVQELQELETEGVYIEGHGKVKAGLLYVAGDNLGSHGVGGFVENFTKSRYFCRYCHVDRPTFFSENGHNLSYTDRNKENYTVALHGRTIVQKKGIKFNSKLNDLQSFHVCNPGLPPCLGHDILEGFAAFDVAYVLHYLVDEEWFTYANINSKIASFPYSVKDRKEKPLPFAVEDKSIKGKMWQIYNAIRLFPIMLAEYVQDVNHPAWQLLLQTGELLNILCAPSMHVSWLGYLKGLIWDYLNLRVSTFPYIPLRPKHHYLSHYCESILFHGPLGKVWTLRFECKHSFFKNCLRSSKCFINVLHSCSNRHEMYQALLRAGGDMRCQYVVVKSSVFQEGKYSHEVVMAISRSVPLVSLRECLKAQIKGTEYAKGNILTLWQTQYDVHVTFGRILLIVYQDEDQLHFVVEVLKSEFVPLCRAYKLGAKERVQCIPYKDLVYYFPLHSYRYEGHILVKLKHALVITSCD